MAIRQADRQGRCSSKWTYTITAAHPTRDVKLDICIATSRVQDGRSIDNTTPTNAHLAHPETPRMGQRLVRLFDYYCAMGYVYPLCTADDG